VIGITAVGPWKDLPRAQEAMARAEKLKPRQMLRFERDEAMWSSGRLSLRTWPDSATVCTCMGVTCGALKRAQREGCANVEAFAEVTGASTVCGSCRPLIATLVEDQPTEIEQDSVWLLGFSVVAAMGALAFHPKQRTDARPANGRSALATRTQTGHTQDWAPALPDKGQPRGDSPHYYARRPALRPAR
jgi:bacterioferritin-associated ferredoxin